MMRAIGVLELSIGMALLGWSGKMYADSLSSAYIEVKQDAVQARDDFEKRSDEWKNSEEGRKVQEAATKWANKVAEELELKKEIVLKLVYEAQTYIEKHRIRGKQPKDWKYDKDIEYGKTWKTLSEEKQEKVGKKLFKIAQEREQENEDVTDGW